MRKWKSYIEYAIRGLLYNWSEETSHSWDFFSMIRYTCIDSFNTFRVISHYLRFYTCQICKTLEFSCTDIKKSIDKVWVKKIRHLRNWK